MPIEYPFLWLRLLGWRAAIIREFLIKNNSFIAYKNRLYSKSIKEVYVNTEKPFHGFFKAGRDLGYKSYLCGVPFNFKFSANKDYEVNLYYNNTDKCEVNIYEIVNTKKGFDFKQLATFDNRIGANNKGCKESVRWF